MSDEDKEALIAEAREIFGEKAAEELREKLDLDYPAQA